jgi:hypothetical protein
MKYLLLIQQGDTPTPGSDKWERLSQDEQNAVYGAYKAVNETPGVTPGTWLAPPEAATTVRVQDGKTLTTDGPFVAIKEALGGYLLFEAEPRHRPHPARSHARGKNPTARRAANRGGRRGRDDDP